MTCYGDQKSLENTNHILKASWTRIKGLGKKLETEYRRYFRNFRANFIIEKRLTEVTTK